MALTICIVNVTGKNLYQLKVELNREQYLGDVNLLTNMKKERKF